MIAAQTAAGFLFCFFFGHAVLHSFKITDSLTCLALCKFCTSARYSVMKACFRNLYITGNLMMISKIFINVGSYNFCCCNRFDHSSRTTCTVSSCKYTWHIQEISSCSCHGYHMEYTDLALLLLLRLHVRL